MNLLGRMLDEREDRQRSESAADERWLQERAGIDPGERLLAWDRWLVATLDRMLVWSAEPIRRHKLLRQCAAEITVVAKQLRGRGWLLDGKELAAQVRAMLEPIATAQRAGKVGDFWPYFRAAVARYVDANAEKIQALARRTGSDEGAQAFGAVLAGLGFGPGGQAREASLTELLASRAVEISEAKRDTLRTRTARARARNAACSDQIPLL